MCLMMSLTCLECCSQISINGCRVMLGMNTKCGSVFMVLPFMHEMKLFSGYASRRAAGIFGLTSVP